MLAAKFKILLAAKFKILLDAKFKILLDAKLIARYVRRSAHSQRAFCSLLSAPPSMLFVRRSADPSEKVASEIE